METPTSIVQRSFKQFEPRIDGYTHLYNVEEPQINLLGLGINLRPNDEAVLFIQAPTGIGKSHQIHEIENFSRRILLIVPRLSIVANAAKRFPTFTPHFDGESYLSDEQMSGVNRLIITPHYLHRLTRFDWDTVVVDEASQCLREMVGIKNKNKEYTRIQFYTLNSLIKINHCVVMSNDIDSYVYKMFSKDKNLKQFYRNTFKNKKDRIVRIHKEPESIYKLLRNKKGFLNIIEGSIDSIKKILDDVGVEYEEVLQADTAQRIDRLLSPAGAPAQIADSEYCTSVMCSGLDLHCFTNTTLLMKNGSKIFNGDMIIQAANRARNATVDVYIPEKTFGDKSRLLSQTEFRVKNSDLHRLRFTTINHLNYNKPEYCELDYLEYYYQTRWNTSYIHRKQQFIEAMELDGANVIQYEEDTDYEEFVQDLDMLIQSYGGADKIKDMLMKIENRMYVGEKQFKESDIYQYIVDNKEELNRLFCGPKNSAFRIDESFRGKPLLWLRNIFRSYGYRAEIIVGAYAGNKAEAKKKAHAALKKKMSGLGNQSQTFLELVRGQWDSASPSYSAILDYLKAYESEYLEVVPTDVHRKENITH